MGRNCSQQTPAHCPLPMFPFAGEVTHNAWLLQDANLLCPWRWGPGGHTLAARHPSPRTTLSLLPQCPECKVTSCQERWLMATFISHGAQSKRPYIHFLWILLQITRSGPVENRYLWTCALELRSLNVPRLLDILVENVSYISWLPVAVIILGW